MYFASNALWKTMTGGKIWQKISPDLTRKTWEVPATVGKYRSADTAKPSQRGVIYTVAPSPLDVNRIWIGTDDGLIQVTADGGATWRDVTPPDLKPFMKVSIMDAGHFDAQTAYAAINTLRLDDLHPHIYRTHDSGATWTAITNGLPDNAPVDAVREDPKRKGLLFAGTEREVFVSFDDGERWQSLRLNMEAKRGDPALQKVWDRLTTKSGPYEDQMFIDQVSNVGREVGQADQKVGASAYERLADLKKEWTQLKADADAALR